MYNLSVEEISMVDGGGDGAVQIAINIAKWVGGNLAWQELTRSHSYTNNPARTGSNQSYGSQGRDTGGCTMQSGGAMAHGRC
ncbi:hypothetical protein M3923_000622 [Vibrio metschnikovii]|uniref:Bacteriocin n=1 Tax=bacterium 19MO03SA05 TaxID=2920620 RepID=A0AAU6VBG8_UNCXX|nr:MULTISPECIES: hypothetical protein [Vibrio]EKO3570932.1 hypothetical protein [Vibrio metschnikovii]EKO3579198.1 hypothetical protein [Vibrio metschnikovii]EKO3582075.1 hypothetical protein [Vibrio metschnikovii]EKO3671992.1 hypothetical protein [Vibrio metschnikovii]EKO3705914.1 hypothetical protein [Vibrio metschnikovii]